MKYLFYILATTLILLVLVSCSTDSTSSYRLITTVSPVEGGTITPDAGTFEEGETISLQATPAEGWIFSKWEQDINTTANPANITINKDYSVVAVFEQRMHPLVISADGEGTVSETVVQQKRTDYAEGTVVELEAVPAENWEFSHWEGDLSGSENPTEITIDEPKEIVAVFMTIPTVTTSSVGSITYNSAQSGGEVSDDGGADVTVRGVVWSTNEIPTLSSSSGSTSDGSGMGSFTSDITGLSSSTTYFLRAYATNSVGTGYGEQINFKSNMESEVVEVTNPVTGRTWMDRNLGASHAATSMTDEQAYGDLYQWGRGSDGHHKRNSPTTDTLSSSDNPGHGSFIIGSSNWRSPSNDELWQGLDGINNPCPEGFRIPTYEEWDAERNSWSSNTATAAFESPLKMPMAGLRGEYMDGSVRNVGSEANYWSSTIYNNTNSIAISLEESEGYLSFGHFKSVGLSVRCIKD